MYRVRLHGEPAIPNVPTNWPRDVNEPWASTFPLYEPRLRSALFSVTVVNLVSDPVRLKLNAPPCNGTGGLFQTSVTVSAPVGFPQENVSATLVGGCRT